MLRLAVSFILLVPLVSAVQLPGLETARVQTRNGLTNGLLLGLTIDVSDSQATPTFHIVAGQTIVQTESATSLPTPVAVRPDAANASSSYANVDLEGSAVIDGGQLIVFPLEPNGSVHIQADCSTLLPKGAETLAGDSHVPTRQSFDHIQRSSATTVQWSPCPQTQTVRLEGDFIVMLWDWNFTLNGQAVTTGYTPGTTPFGSMVGKQTEIVAFLQQAVLDVPITGHFAAFLAAGPRIQHASSLTLQKATGTIFGATLRQSDVQLEGTLNATLVPTANAFAADVEGDVRQASADGRILALTTPAQNRPDWLLPTGLAALGLVFVWVSPALLALTGRMLGAYAGQSVPRSLQERRAQGYWMVANWFNRRHQTRLAVRLARHAMHVAPDVPDHATLAAFASMERHQYLAAYTFLRRADELIDNADRRALIEVELAALCIRLNQRHEAVEWLAEATRTSPDVTADELDRPEFRGLTKAKQPEPAGQDPSFA